MKTSRLLIILVVLLILTITFDKSFKKNSTQIPKGEKNISPTITPAPSFTPTPTVFLPTQTPTRSQSSGQVLQDENNNSGLIYPNSTVIFETGNAIVLQSQDNPQTITDWYKQKIESLNLNAQSFVSTNTNGNILNKLVGTNREKEIRVEISKKANEAIVEIRVDQSE